MPTSKQLKFGRVIFIDRSLASKRLPDLLERMGFEVEIHKEYFVHDEDDDKWIAQVTERNWVILTGDKKLTVEQANVDSILSSKSQVLLVTDTNSLPEQWAASIIVGKQRIEDLLKKHPGPVVIKIGKSAREHVNVAKEHIFPVNENAEQREAFELTPPGIPGGDSRPPESETRTKAAEAKAEGEG